MLRSLFILFLTTLSAGLLSCWLSAQESLPEPPPTPPPPPVEKALKANPADDLFLMARHAYQEALDTKDSKKKKLFYNVANRQFTKFIEKHPEHKNEAGALYYQALCYRGMGSDKKAYESFSTLVKKWPTGKLSGLAAYQLASRDYQAKSYAPAAEFYAKAASESGHEKTSQLSLFMRALCYQKLGQKDQLEKALAVVVNDSDNPYQQQAAQALAYVLRDKGAHQEALTLFKSLSQLTGEKHRERRADSILQTALLATKVKDKKLATEYFNLLYETPGLEEWHGEAQLALMNFHHEAGHSEAVIKEYEKGTKGSFRLEGKAKLTRVKLAVNAYTKLALTDKATPLYAEIARLDSGGKAGFEAGYLALAARYPDGKNFAKNAETFLKKYEKSHLEDPQVHNLHLMLAETYYAKKQYKTAAARLEKINFRHLPEGALPNLLYKLSNCHHELGNKETALSSWNYFINQYSEDTRYRTALTRRAELLESMGKDKDAILDYARLWEKADNDEWKRLCLLRLAVLYKKTNNLTRLIATHQKFLTLFPNAPAVERSSSHFWLGWALYRMKELDTAISQFRTARELDEKNYDKEIALHLSLAHFSREEIKPLESELKRLFKIDRKTAEKLPTPLFAWLGVKTAKAERYVDAHRYLKLGVNRDEPSETQNVVWSSYALSAIESHKYRDAIFPIEWLLTQEKAKWTRAQLYHQLARAHLGLKSHDLAAEAANNGLEIKPVGDLNAKLRLNLGDALTGLGSPEEAVKHYVTVVELIGKNPILRQEAMGKAISAFKKIGTASALKQAAQYEAELKNE